MFRSPARGIIGLPCCIISRGRTLNWSGRQKWTRAGVQARIEELSQRNVHTGSWSRCSERDVNNNRGQQDGRSGVPFRRSHQTRSCHPPDRLPFLRQAHGCSWKRCAGGGRYSSCLLCEDRNTKPVRLPAFTHAMTQACAHRLPRATRSYASTKEWRRTVSAVRKFISTWQQRGK